MWQLVQSSDQKHFIAICSFKHHNAQSLSFKIGDRLEVVEETEEWYRGFLIKEPSKLGIFPKNYVKKYKPDNLIHKDQSVTEIQSVLREWTSVLYQKYEECKKEKIFHLLIGHYENSLNLKNYIVEDRLSIDEIKDLKKQIAVKILHGNSLLGLDVIAYDSNYNRLDPTKATTIFLYDELKKNNNIGMQFNKQKVLVSAIPNDSVIETNSINTNKMHHQSSNVSVNQSSTATTFCLKLSVEQLIPNLNSIVLDDTSELYVNLFLSKDNFTNGYYLCENAVFSIKNDKKFALFFDISEKDFKSGFQLYLVAYVVKYLKLNKNDRYSSISRIYAGGVSDLSSKLFNLIKVEAENSRHIRSSMILHIVEYFESSIVTPKILNELISKDTNESYRTIRNNSSKETYFSLSFACDLIEASFKKACDQFPTANCMSRKMNFPEIIMPDDFRNDFYITVIGGEFQKARNYEFIVNLVQFKNEFGTSYEEVPIDLYEDGSSDMGDGKQRFFFHKSMVYAKQDKPKWNEIVNVSIPHGMRLGGIKKAYVRFLIRKRPLNEKEETKIIGRCYLQITNEDGSAIQDNHSFVSMSEVRSDEVISTDGVFIRLKTPLSIQKHSQIAQPYPTPDRLKDFIEIKVKVVSTQLTQNVTLLNLLSFKTEPRPSQEQYYQLLSNLDKLLSVKDQQSAEIVKFLQAILDKLIDILLDLKKEHALDIHTKQIQPCVFEILVAIFQIIENQSKFASFRTVIDAYLTNNFCITLAHRPFLRLFLNLVNSIYDKYSQSLSNINNRNTTNFPKLTAIETSPSEYPNSSGIESGCLFDSTNNVDSLDYETALNTIKSIEYIFKFAFRSRELLTKSFRSNSQSSELKQDTFDTDVNNIFDKLVQISLLKTSSIDTLNGSTQVVNLTKIQSFILKYSISLMPILIDSERYTIEKISQLYTGFLQSKFVLQTQFLSKLIKSKLFESPKSRNIIMPPLCEAFKTLLTITDSEKKQGKFEVKLEAVGRIIAELMHVLEKPNIGSISSNIHDLRKILGQIINTFIYFSPNQSEIKQLFATVTISIFRTMSATHFHEFFEYSASLLSTPLLESLLSQNLSSNDSSHIDIFVDNNLIETKNISQNDSSAQLVCIKLLYTCKKLLDVSAFPKDWFDLLILRSSVISNALYNISVWICENHLRNFNELNKKIWFDYFECMVNLAVDPSLQLEKFNENKRKCILQNYKDIRVKVAEEVKNMWFKLDTNKKEFIPNMVEPFMLVALIPIPEIHNTIIPLFFDMMLCEYSINVQPDFEKYTVQYQLVTTLDIQVCDGNGDIQFKQAFERIFTEKFNSHSYFKTKVSFVKKVVNLYDLLSEYRDLAYDTFDQMRTFYLNEILLFYNNMDRSDIYIEYVQMLREIHKACGNEVSAAYTLRLHAELLNWTVDDGLKEKLFSEIINDYTDGQAWEEALEFSKILRERYESQFELQKLHDLLRIQAELCENIIKKQRCECKYFLVGFFGKGFPNLLQNKKFVFRGEQFEQIIGFRPRIESWFPNAQRIAHSNPVTEIEINSNKQYIQVISVQPVYVPKEKFKNLNISNQILNYYQHNQVDKFKYSYRKESKLDEHNATLWWTIEKTISITDTLPNVINFYPSINETTLEISPIQNALNKLQEQMDKLNTSFDDIEKNMSVDENTKSLLQGTIDAGVNGGLPKYKIFFDEKYKVDNAEGAKKTDQLKSAIIETINLADQLLNSALSLTPNDELLLILFDEQLPKLKNIFEIPHQATLRKKRIPSSANSQISFQTNQRNTNSNYSVETTPRNLFNYSNNGSISESRQNKSVLRMATENYSYTGRNIISYLVGDKGNSQNSQFHTGSIGSHRDSISSIKSINSESEENRNKILLDEPVNPKRPLRPSNRLNHNITSSPSNSNQSSRPVSHLSGDDFSMNNSISMQQINNNVSLRLGDSFSFLQEEEGSQNMKPPPKPPKPTNIKLKSNFITSSGTPSPTVLSDSSTSHNISSQSSDNLKNSNNSIYEQQTKSTASLNGLQKIKSLASKKLETTSDSVLNKIKITGKFHHHNKKD